ncbi:MAG: peptide-methionine (S)-S-oxide reductase MsrA [Gammaproteobacteria bacterium]|nr:peptide-methionine (S)-S-oxide reductase MsrA [Rhodocyclaceae bacterium]MBU3908248.1 peptide-methionine (S)-S-oxide reductase MsrA [Gammaproteobacteria bacterium]MBU3990536.1 peptide-methionine (S)-S-oxide reductase MsrA [Gammaproteobacteria bacterium]MBU4003115.1 peptide-methionine (S)-S-oxide reductase MsrA [Gammaproteobacteria bacterium]MBU4019957.1 peptide-methionine (S)-S-oxide reductase MsrA [Gammaproteobacteria bacterium]
MTTYPATELATLGGGCFWCVEAALKLLDGVIAVISGYCGGAVEQPSYQQICTGNTGHAEVVSVEFDPAIIDYRTLLTAFFTIHDPTTLNRQGHDVGTQYRSVVFTHSPQQTDTAQALIKELDAARIWPASIVSAVLPAPTFWPAEEYHQNYFARNATQGYCQAFVAPKVAKLRQRFAARLKPG